MKIYVIFKLLIAIGNVILSIFLSHQKKFFFNFFENYIFFE